MVFVNLVVTEIPALLRWLGRVFFDSALPPGAAKDVAITVRVTKGALDSERLRQRRDVTQISVIV